jgi:hypothetical protein
MTVVSPETQDLVCLICVTRSDCDDYLR